MGLWVADRLEHEPRMVIGTIVGTLVSVFVMRMLVVTFGLRSYRLST